jgi:hypothetical protein
MSKRSSILSSVHAVETASETDFETVCESPLCSVSFPQSGLMIEPKRFCSDKCRQQASIIRRASKLLAQMPDDKALEILRGKP